ncbi:MAG: hypothetical protein Q4G27_10255 [Flavobacteriaceae bacterium]|nr:hypothetical protein [Flavobacteriaceae bacterium]
MKTVIKIFIIVIGSFTGLSAQVAIETETVRGDGIMDFPSPADKGILLPLVNSANEVDAVGGAMIFSLEHQQIMFYDAAVNSWMPMTKGLAAGTVQGPEHSGERGRFTENAENGAIISAGTPTEDPIPVGVLVLDSMDKALILPQVPDATQLAGPKAGMICYDMRSDSIAVFDGENWSFWN